MDRFYGGIRKLVKVLVFILFRFKIIGEGNIPEDRNYIACCNHISMCDPVFIMLAEKKRPVRFMAKESVFKMPVLGSVFRRIGAISVSRGGKGNLSAVKQAEDAIKRGDVLGIFPEGTRSRNGDIQQGKTGAVMIANKCGADILPCALVVSRGRVRPFKRITLCIGPLIPVSEIAVSGISSSDLREGTRKIMSAIAGLKEQNQ